MTSTRFKELGKLQRADYYVISFGQIQSNLKLDSLEQWLKITKQEDVHTSLDMS